jgi:hypothetical protein
VTLGADRFLREIQIAARLSHPHIVAGRSLACGEPAGCHVPCDIQSRQEMAMRAWVSLGLAATLACGSTDVGPDVGPEDFALPPGAAPPVVTDASVYALTKVSGGFDAQAEAVYTNRTGRTVYYQRCLRESEGPIHWLRRTGPDSTAPSFVGGAWACVGGVPTGRVRPGEVLRAQVWLGSTDSPQARPPITPEERVGRFRVEFALCVRPEADSDDCEPLPAPARESNAFEVRFGSP